MATDTAAAESDTNEYGYREHQAEDTLLVACKSGHYQRGQLRVSKYHRQEAYVRAGSAVGATKVCDTPVHTRLKDDRRGLRFKISSFGTSPAATELLMATL